MASPVYVSKPRWIMSSKSAFPLWFLKVIKMHMANIASCGPLIAVSQCVTVWASDCMHTNKPREAAPSWTLSSVLSMKPVVRRRPSCLNPPPFTKHWQTARQIASGCKRKKVPDLSNWIKTNTFKTRLLLLPSVSTKPFFSLSSANLVRVTPCVPTESYYFHIYVGSSLSLWSPAPLKRLILLWLVPVNTLKCSRIRRSWIQWWKINTSLRRIFAMAP